LVEALQHCVAQLAPAASQLVELRYQKAWDFARIAIFLGRTVEATRQQLSRIRLVLRDCIEKQLAQP
jgi:RNA polymerase sigma-70 factor (ECF subfamily)